MPAASMGCGTMADDIINAPRFVTFPCPFVPNMIYEIFAIRRHNLWGFVRISITPIVTCHAKYLSIRAYHPKGLALVEYRQGKFGYVNPHSGEEYFCE